MIPSAVRLFVLQTGGWVITHIIAHANTAVKFSDQQSTLFAGERDVWSGDYRRGEGNEGMPPVRLRALVIAAFAAATEHAEEETEDECPQNRRDEGHAIEGDGGENGVTRVEQIRP